LDYGNDLNIGCKGLWGQLKSQEGVNESWACEKFRRKILDNEVRKYKLRCPRYSCREAIRRLDVDFNPISGICTGNCRCGEGFARRKIGVFEKNYRRKLEIWQIFLRESARNRALGAL
jgi:hypothetical protein